MAETSDLREWLGEIDIYLFDQLLKGRFTPEMRVLDAGCGGGRNLVYFLRSGYDVCAVDQSAESILQVSRLSALLAPRLPATNFRVEMVEKMSFDDESFDAVISSAVLHFARDEDHFQKMLREMWRVLRPRGILFSRLASTISVEKLVQPLGNGRYHLPDGSVRFLVDEAKLLRLTGELGGELFEPIKTVNVQNMRAMTTWCLRKSSRARGEHDEARRERVRE